MTIDRAMLLHLLALLEPHGFLGDVKLQQIAFLCELQLFTKRLRALHFEFFRYAYGAFSKDLDNDLMSLRRKERVENFSVTEPGMAAVELLVSTAELSDANRQVFEILQAVTTTYGPQDSSAVTKAVERVEVSTPEQPDFKLAIEHISFHTTMLVPSRIEVDAEFTVPAATLAKLNAALGY
jgi:hypothetical protein